MEIFNDPRILLLGELFEADKRLVRIFDQHMKEQCGIPLTWYEVLLWVGRAGTEGMTMGQLANFISLTTGGVTRLVDRVEAAGYVRRAPSPGDRRVYRLIITELGRQKLQEATTFHIPWIDEYLINRLEPQEVDCLRLILKKLNSQEGSSSEPTCTYKQSLINR